MGFIVLMIFGVWTYIGWQEWQKGQIPQPGFDNQFKAGPWWWGRSVVIAINEIKSALDKS